MKNNIKWTFLLVSILIFVFACKNEVKPKELEIYSEDTNRFELIMNDTISVSNIARGSINYDTELDTLKASDIKKRYIFLHLISQSNKRLTFDEIKSKSDWIYVDSLNLNGDFKFNILCDKIGYNTINLAIEDVIILNDLVDDKVRILTDEISIAKDIYVSELISRNM